MFSGNINKAKKKKVTFSRKQSDCDMKYRMKYLLPTNTEPEEKKGSLRVEHYINTFAEGCWFKADAIKL